VEQWMNPSSASDGALTRPVRCAAAHASGEVMCRIVWALTAADAKG
jgi:hypothetical protein